MNKKISISIGEKMQIRKQTLWAKAIANGFRKSESPETVAISGLFGCGEGI